MPDSHPRTLVLGLGNPILTDDGVGVHVARAVQARIAEGVGGERLQNIAFAEASVGGLRLLEILAGYERVILVDAIQTPDGVPGDICQLSLAESRGVGGADLRSSLHAGSAHDLSLAGALDWGRHMGMALPDNASIVIVAVEAEDVLTFGETCTPGVVIAIPRAVDMVLALVNPQSL